MKHAIGMFFSHPAYWYKVSGALFAATAYLIYQGSLWFALAAALMVYAYARARYFFTHFTRFIANRGRMEGVMEAFQSLADQAHEAGHEMKFMHEGKIVTVAEMRKILKDAME